METPDTLKVKLNCDTDEELGALFFVGFKAVSAWRRNGVPERILRQAEAILKDRRGISDQSTLYSAVKKDRPQMKEALRRLDEEGDEELAKMVLQLLNMNKR